MPRQMSMRDAMALVDDDLPDGAYWGLVHEMAGAEYGEAWEEVFEAEGDTDLLLPPAPVERFQCPTCLRRFTSRQGRSDHAKAKGHQVCRRDTRKPERLPAGVAF